VALPDETHEAPGRTLAPSEWPTWVLAFRGGTYPDNPVKHEAMRSRFHQWQADRSAWREAHTQLDGSAFLIAAAEERERRR
jgi:hypothetical protein